MFTASDAVDLRGRLFDERISKLVEDSLFLTKATWEEPVSGGTYSNDHYDVRVKYIREALIVRGFTITREEKFNEGNIYEKMIFHFTWANAEPTVATETQEDPANNKYFSITRNDGEYIGMCYPNSKCVVDPVLRRLLFTAKEGQTINYLNYEYTRVS